MAYGKELPEINKPKPRPTRLLAQQEKKDRFDEGKSDGFLRQL